jgi:hypothetical protein
MLKYYFIVYIFKILKILSQNFKSIFLFCIFSFSFIWDQSPEVREKKVKVAKF